MSKIIFVQRESVFGDHKRQKLVSNAQKLFAYCVKSNTDFDKFSRMVESQPLISLSYPAFFYSYYRQVVCKRFSYSWPQLFKL